jgi:hypothetical protein
MRAFRGLVMDELARQYRDKRKSLSAVRMKLRSLLRNVVVKIEDRTLVRATSGDVRVKNPAV